MRVCVCLCGVSCVCFPNTIEIILILLATRHSRIHLLKNLISKLSSYIYVCIWPCNVYSREIHSRYICIARGDIFTET